MKKHVLSLIGIFCFAISFAQSPVTTMTGSGDTLVNTTPDYVTIAPTLFYEQVSFQAKMTKIGGTIAGYAVIQASCDGTNYNDLNTDSLKPTDVTTNTKIWVIAYNPHLHYRIKYVGVGTMSAKIYGYCLTSNSRGKHAVYSMTQAYGSASDTVVNTATGYVGLTVLNHYERVGIQTVITEISGTTGGTVTLQGSIDGTNYVTVSSSFSDAQTYTPTDVAVSSKLFTVTGSPYKYYRLSYTGTGTMSATIKGYLVPSK